MSTVVIDWEGESITLEMAYTIAEGSPADDLNPPEGAEMSLQYAYHNGRQLSISHWKEDFTEQIKEVIWKEY